MDNLENIKTVENETTEYDVIKACCGENQDGHSKVTLTTAIIEFNGDINDDEEIKQDYNYNTVATRIIRNGVLNIEVRDGIVQLDIRFKSFLDPELRLLWDMLETYGQRRFEAQNNPNLDFIPHIIFEGLPEEFSNKYVISFTNPMLWFLQPKSPEKEELSVIRIFFNDSNFEVQSIEGAFDTTQLEAEAMRTYDTIYIEK